MGENRIRLYRAVPGPTSLRPLIELFARGKEGIVTAFEDSMLPALNGCIGEDSDIEVVPFGVVVRRTLEMAGEEARPLATADQYAVAVGQAARELSDDSRLATAAARFPGIRKEIVRALKELGEWGIDLDKASELAPEVPHIRELRDLERGAAHLLRSMGRDTHLDQLRACQEAVVDPDSPRLRLLIFASGGAPPAKLEWIKWAASQGAEAWVVAERHATDGALFADGDVISKALQVPSKVIGDGNRLTNNLFAVFEHGGPEVSASIVSAADPLAECEWALRGCLDRMESGSVAIYVRDPNSYVPLLASAAERLGVPLQIRGRVGLLQNSFARMTLGVLEACAGRDVGQFGALIRSSYLGLDGANRAILLAAIKDSRCRKQRQWEALGEWLDAADECFAWIRDVVRWRTEVLQSSVGLREWRHRLMELVDLLPWHEALEVPKGFDTQRDVRAFWAMHVSLENEAVIERMANSRDLSLGEFAKRCRKIWEAADVSVPSTPGIPVSSSALAIGGADSVFVLGMLEGVFPRRRSEDPILPDSIRERLSALFPDRTPLRTSRDIGAAERDEFYRVCAAAVGSITFSYPLTEEDRDNVPAFYLEAVKETGLTVRTIDRPRSQLVPHPNECVAASDQRLAAALEAPREEPPAVEITSITAALALRSGDEAIYPEALRDVLECPFRFQVRSRLRAPVKSRQTHWFTLGNLPLVAGLATSTGEAEARAKLDQALEAQLDLLIPEAGDWELKLLRSGGARLVREWVEREFRARKIWPRRIDTSAVNVRLGDHGTNAQLPGGRKLKGTIPVVTKMSDLVKLFQLYGVRVPAKDDVSDSDKLLLGLYFLIGYENGIETALELEGFDGRRTLVVLTRNRMGPLRNDGQELKVLDLGEADDPVASKRKFFEDVKELIARATARVDRGEIRPEPGDHCERCDFGELCRRSNSFSDDDSPFMEDDASEVA